jgi:hypothetical protein
MIEDKAFCGKIDMADEVALLYSSKFTAAQPV